MKNEIPADVFSIIENLRKIMKDRDLKQAEMALYADTTPSQMSKILAGQVQLSLKQLSNIARNLNISIVDVITYPETYAPRVSPSSTKVLVEIDVNNDEFIKMGLKDKIIQVLNK